MVKIEDDSIFDQDAPDKIDNVAAKTPRCMHHLPRNNYGPLSIPTGIIQIVDFDLSVRAEPG